MNRKLKIIGIAAAVCVGAASTAHAGPKPQTIDQVGDGNAINGQGVVPVPGTVTPVYATSLDIASVLWSTDKPGKAATKLIVKMVLAGPVTSGGAALGGTYRAMSKIGACTFGVVFSNDVAGVMGGPVGRVCGAAGGTTDRPVAVTLAGNKITWSVPLASFAAAGLKPGAILSSLSADAALNIEGNVGPIFDEASGPVTTYRVGD